MVKTIKLALAAAALTSVTAIAIAQTTPVPSPQAAPATEKADKKDGSRMGHRMARIDADKDGSVTMEEFSSASKMKEADVNNDGELAHDELIAMLQKRDYERRAEQMTRRMDIDGDGKVTIKEIEQHRGKQFALMDRNNDGKLEGRELRRGHFGGDDRRDGRRGERGERRGDRGEWRRGDDRHHGRGFDRRGDMQDDGPREL
jgi:Ca2+-binding EF-hand superfamily protein